MLFVLIFLIIPFVQLGVSYYASFSTLLLALVLGRWATGVFGAIQSIGFVPIIALLMFMPLLLETSWALSADSLRTGREAVMFILLALALIGLRTPAPGSKEPPIWMFGALASSWLLICVVQTYYLPRGIYVGIPETYFAQESGTIPGALDLKYSAEFLRPSGTFSEPSYLGFILLSLSLMLVPRLDRARQAGVVLAVMVVAGLLSRSLAFLLAMAGVILMPIMIKRQGNRGLIIAGTSIVAVLTLMFTDAAKTLSRLIETTANVENDLSSFVRIAAPLEALPRYLVAYPFGAPHSTIERAMLPFTDIRVMPDEILHNALFNMMFLYGIVGLAIFVTLVYLAKDLHVRMYIIAGTFFSGAFLAIDKVAIIILTLAVYETGKRAAADRERNRAMRDTSHLMTGPVTAQAR